MFPFRHDHRNSMEMWLRIYPTVSRELHSGRETLNVETSPRPISIGQLRALLHFHIRPINPVVFRGPYQINSVGTLILRRASRLDAFSGYHFQT